jgi:DNA topoisomerase I
LRRTRFKKTFYGCSRYPECKFTSWDKPVAEPCPNCGSPILADKFDKKSGETTRHCIVETCKYEKAVA